MFTVIAVVVAAAAGFVTGVLVGRTNKKAVEAALARVKELEAKLGIK